MNNSNNGNRSGGKDSFDFSGTGGWLGGTGYQENNEFGNNNFDDINTYDSSSDFAEKKDVPPYQQHPQPYQQPARPYQQPARPYQQPPQPYQQPARPYQQPQQPYQQGGNVNGGAFPAGAGTAPYKDEFRDPFNSKETKDLEDAVEASRTPPPLPMPEPKKMSVGLVLSFFAWILVTTGATGALIFLGETWTTLPYAFQLFAGLLIFFMAWPVKRSRAFAAFAVFDAAFIGIMVLLRITDPMLTLALSKHSAIHFLEAVLIFWGFYLSVGKIITGPKKKKNCTEMIQGTCLKVITDYIPDGRGKAVSIYRPVYQYAYNGKHFESFDNDNPKLNAPKTGSTCALLIDPDNPSDIYAVNKKTTASVLFFLFGLALIAGSVIFFVMEMSDTLRLMSG